MLLIVRKRKRFGVKKKKKNMKVSTHNFPTHKALWEKKGRSCSVWKFDDLRGQTVSSCLYKKNFKSDKRTRHST